MRFRFVGEETMVSYSIMRIWGEVMSERFNKGETGGNSGCGVGEEEGEEVEVESCCRRVARAWRKWVKRFDSGQ